MIPPTTKVLLDESIPRRFADLIPAPISVRTVHQMRWAGRSNGELLQIASEHGFDAIVTLDKGFGYQHNLDELPIAVIVLVARSNRLADLRHLGVEITAILPRIDRRVYRVGAEPCNPAI